MRDGLDHPTYRGRGMDLTIRTGEENRTDLTVPTDRGHGMELGIPASKKQGWA